MIGRSGAAAGTGAVALAALAPVAMLAVDPAGLYPFGPVKWLAVTVLVSAGAAAVLAGGPLRFAPWPTVGAGLLVTWMAVAAVGGEEPLYAWTGTPERHLGVLAWALCALALVAGQSLDPARAGPVLCAGLAAAGLGVGAVATVEALGWEPSVLDAESRLTATFGSSAYLGAAVALLAPVAVGLAADRRLAPAVRIAAGVAVVALAVASAGAGARAAWVGLVAAALATAWLRRRELARDRRATLATGGLGAVALAGLVLLSPVGGRLSSMFDPDEPGGRGRLDEWRVATRVLAEHPVAGVGPEGYRVAFATGADESYERAHGRTPLPDRAHAGPLDVGLAGGFPALAAWAVVVAGVGRFVVRALRSGPPWVAGVAAGLVAYVGGQVLLFPVAELDPLAWLLAGVVVSAMAVPGELRRWFAPRLVPAAVGVAAALALVAGALDVAADRRAAAAADALARGDGPGALDAATDAVGLRPDVIRLRVLEARALVAADRGALAAIGALDHALDVSPGDPVVLLERARLMVDRARATRVPEHVAAARAELDRLLERDPVNAALWSQAGAAAGLAGDLDAAEAAWRRAEGLAPADPAPATDLALLYLESGRTAQARSAIGRALARAPEDGRALRIADRIAERIAERGPGTAPGTG